MQRSKNQRSKFGPEHRQVFLNFLREVSPGADPKTIVLFAQLMRARNLLAQAAERDLGAVGLTSAELRLLMNLLHQERYNSGQGLLPSELSELQDISPNTVSALINSLETAGFITRELHPHDHRKFVIHLTTSGRKVVKAKLRDHLRCISNCFDTLNTGERETLFELLSRLNGDLEEGAERTTPGAEEA